MADVLVWQAGLGGLAAAARLAMGGHHVTVVDAAASPAELAGSITHDGYTFDIGPSFLTLPAVYRDLFLKTATRPAGARLEDNVEMRPLDVVTACEWPDGTRAFLPGTGVRRFADEVQRGLGGDSAHRWNALQEKAAELWGTVRLEYLDAPMPEANKHAPSRRRRLFARSSPKSLHALASHYLRDPRLVALVDSYATHQEVDPSSAPVEYSVAPYVEETFGAWHVTGGLGRLATAIHERCVELGVEFRFGETLPVDAPIVVMQRDANHAWRGATTTSATFGLLLGVAGRTPGIAHHNVWFSDASSAEPTIYANVPDDPTMRPDDDSESWVVWMHTSREETINPGCSQFLLDALAHRGVDLRPRLRWQQELLPTVAATTRQRNKLPATTQVHLVNPSRRLGVNLPLPAMDAAMVAHAIGRA